MGNPASFVTAASLLDVNTFTQLQTFSGGVAVTGGITGGVRQILPFGEPNIAFGDNASPALSTPVVTHWCGVTALGAVGFVAPRAGSLTGLSVNLSVAAAGSNVIFGVYKNGTIFNAAAIVTLASATSDVKANTTFAEGTYTFAAGDIITVYHRAGSGWTATTSDASVAVEIVT
jgi:hypothetical protein